MQRIRLEKITLFHEGKAFVYSFMSDAYSFAFSGIFIYHYPEIWYSNMVMEASKGAVEK